MNVHVFYVLELKTKEQKFRLSICISVCTLGHLCVLSGCKITFEGVRASNQNWVGVFYV